MRELRLLLAILILILLPSCAVAPEPIQVDGNNTEVGIKLIGQAESIGVVVSFYLESDEYTHVVQEITLGSGSTLVESFHWDGSIMDRHYWNDRPHYRSMKVYAAVVEGADEAHGFAHLPQNVDGSVKTTVSNKFNAWYWRDYEMRGEITKASPYYFIWTIEDDGKTITVSLPETK